MSPDERISWQPVLEEAAAVVESYDSGVTLRQLFYRLVARQRIPNSEYAYKKLSERTAMARRRGAFPDLIDRTRTIHVDRGFAGPAEALQRLADAYRRDRTEGQATSIYLGAEKAGYVELLRSWFEPLGLPVLALGGYASQTYVDEVVADVRTQDRRAVMLYAGDFDATGLDI